MSVRATAGLRGLFPQIGPWTTAVLWHGVREYPTPSTPIGPELGVIAQAKLAGLAVDYLTVDHQRALAVGPRVIEDFRNLAFDWMTRSQRVAHSAQRVIDELTSVGVATAVSKGPGIAAAYASTTWRPYADIDLIVDRNEFRRSLDHLRSIGWAEADYNVQPRSYFARLCQEGVNLRDHSGGSIDLHHQIPPWRWGRMMDIVAMIERAQPLAVAGANLPCLTREDNAIVAALHIVSDRNKPGESLIVWRDIVTLLDDTDPDRMIGRLTDCGLEHWCQAVVAAVPSDVRPSVFRRLESGPVVDGRHLAALLSPRTAQLGVGATQVIRLPWLNALAFVFGMALPSRRFLAIKFPRQQRRLLRWWARTVLNNAFR